MTDEAKWLLDWFCRRLMPPGSTQEEQLQVNYFEAGLIDSFGVIELITEIEQNFDIRFSEKHFQERRFATIGGLGELIEELTNSKGPKESPGER